VTTLAALQSLIAQGESETLELKRPSVELRRAGEALCAFLNGALEAAPSRQFAPFIFEAKPYKRVDSTTTVMSQEEYARLLLDRNHSRYRWENQPAVGVRLEDLDRKEILRTRGLGAAGRVRLETSLT